MDTSAKSASGSTNVTPARSETGGWRQAAPWLAACALALGSGLVNQWQTTRIGVLGDYAYILDTAWRIAQGEVMYRDFVLPHSPLTFHVQATLIKVFGFSYQVTVWYCTVVNVLYVLLTYRLLRVVVSGWSAVGLCLPLVWLAPHSIYPHPFYDPDAALLVLLNLNLLHWVAIRSVSPVVAFLCGATTVLPALAKQNVGYPYVGLVLVGIGWWAWQYRRPSADQTNAGNLVGIRWFGIGIIGGIVAAAIWLGTAFGLNNYWFWVFVSAGRRLGLPVLWATYGNWELWADAALLTLGWWLWRYRKKQSHAGFSWLPTASLALLSAPFVKAVAVTYLFGFYYVEFDYPLLSLWIPIMVLALVAGLCHFPFWWRAASLIPALLPWVALALAFFSFLSQGYIRSSYGIWAFFALITASIVGSLIGNHRQVFVCWGMGILLALAAVPYIQHNIRLRYVVQRGDTLQTVSVGPLQGFTAFSPQLSNFGELLVFVSNHIPEAEPIVCIPHEDPFYVVTGRRDPLPITVFDRTASPFPPEEILKEVERRQVKWVIIKKRLQMDWILAREITGLREQFIRRYQIAAQLGGYVVLYQPAPAEAVSQRLGDRECFELETSPPPSR